MGRLVLLVMTLWAPLGKLYAQGQEVQQLLLNVEKLAQMKEILEQMKSGYQMVAKGYLAVKEISEGNFSLHKTFMDGLVTVNPAVSKYYKVVEIVRKQAMLVKSCKATLQQLKGSELLQPGELDYVVKVSGNLLKESLRQTQSLVLVLTSESLRMSDEERLAAIDRIAEETTSQFTFFRSFSAEAKMLLMQRFKEHRDNAATRQVLGK